MEVDGKVKAILDSTLKPTVLERLAFGCSKKTGDFKMKVDATAEKIRVHWQEFPQEQVPIAMQTLVSHVLRQGCPLKTEFILCVLEQLVDQNVFSARMVCESLLNSPYLTVNQSAIWCLSFGLIKRIVGGVFYKGTRDLLHAILSKVLSLDCTTNVAVGDCVRAVDEVIQYILDRNTCLLPSYFALNEVIKMVGDEHTNTKPASQNVFWSYLGETLHKFVESFHKSAQLVSVIGRSKLLPVVGFTTGQVWKLAPVTLRFQLLGPLPYGKELYESQSGFLRYVLEQPYSRDTVCSLLSLNKTAKQRCPVLETELVNLIVSTMEDSEDGLDSMALQLRWQHLGSQVIFFVLFNFVSFSHMVDGLYNKLKDRELEKGRDLLMWVLLQFISGSIQKNPLEDFLPVIGLYDLLYPEQQPLPVPGVSDPTAVYQLAPTCIWIHLNRKAASSNVTLYRPIPYSLSDHTHFLQQILSSRLTSIGDYKIALLCNAYSTNSDLFNMPMGFLIDSIYGSQQTTLLPGNVTAFAPTVPLSMELLDRLTVHAKMSVIHSIGTKVIKLAQQARGAMALAPALLETYSRLLVYVEIESLGIKGFINQVLPTVVKSNAQGILHSLLEMFCYRLHHIQPHLRIHVMSFLINLPASNNPQLHLCMETAILRLVMGLGIWELLPQVQRVFTAEHTKAALISNDSEEVNRALILRLAQAVHITGPDSGATWCKDLLQLIQHHTPHTWSNQTIDAFPPIFKDFYCKLSIPKEDQASLKRNIETEHRKWKSMMSEGDLINYFSTTTNQPLFLCILWKSMMEDGRISPTAYKVLEKIGQKGLSAHVRMLVDFLAHDILTVQKTGETVMRTVNALNELIWQCNIVTLDRVILTIALRMSDGNEAQAAVFIIHTLLLKMKDFNLRVREFVSTNTADHWALEDWHAKHMAMHTKFPEKFAPEAASESVPGTHQYLPVYFSNVCLRFIPVLDIMIHRFLEFPNVSKSFESLLDAFGCLYRFHEAPITYVYTTLHYYEPKIADNHSLKKKLVGSILCKAFSNDRDPHWCLSNDYLQYLEREDQWQPGIAYYSQLVDRLHTTMLDLQPSPFPSRDWRFNEFPNAVAHALHCTCVELLSIPVSSYEAANHLLDLVLVRAGAIRRSQVHSWINCVALLLTVLPMSYWRLLFERILKSLSMDTLADPNSSKVRTQDIFNWLNFSQCFEVYEEHSTLYVMALSHAFWQHASIGQLTMVPTFLQQQVKPMVKTEKQLIFVCELLGPLLQRFNNERTRCLCDVTIELYEMLEQVDQSCGELHHMDAITDFLYHIKYMFVGDGVKTEVEKMISNMRPALQLRLRYISYHGKDEAIGSASNN